MINSISKYRVENKLNRQDFCERFQKESSNYKRDFEGRQWIILESSVSDILLKVEGEFHKRVDDDSISSSVAVPNSRNNKEDAAT